MAAYFSIVLTIVTLSCGLIWLIDVLFFAKKRREEEIKDANFVVDTASSIFPVLAFVLIVRSFIYEPFQIPSGSMMPTLLVGDFILVQKFSYGLKDPIWQKTIIPTGKPKRGDIIVFKYPKNPAIDYIKRVVGLPGDTIRYKDKKLYIKAACSEEPCSDFVLVARTSTKEILNFSQNGDKLISYNEKLGDVEHKILINQNRLDDVMRYYNEDGSQAGDFFVPEGKYFAMGDNRDNSADSRYWGFVPEENVVGKATAIWMSFEFDRKSVTWLPSKVRFSRIGSIK